MEPALNLDLAARAMDARRKAWAEHGFEVGALTWRDRARGWPWQLVNRVDAADPDSVGFRVRKGSAEGAVVLFRGGWADTEWWSGNPADDPEVGAPDIPDLAALNALLDTVLRHWPELVHPQLS
jgi:hypothetical protein